MIAIIYFAYMYQPMMSSDIATSTVESASTTTTSHGAVTNTKAPARVQPTKNPGHTSTATSPVPDIHWRFMGHPTATNAQPSTDVTVSVNDKEYELGTYLGTCKLIEDGALVGTGEVSGVLCLVGDEGTELGVFRSGAGFVVQKGDVTFGDARTPDTRKAFVTIQKLP